MNELATIRRAYRYVVAYERRILDAMAAIDDTVQRAGFERSKPHRWAPIYQAFPSRDWAPDHWAWDHVPIYACRFEWLIGDKNTAGNRFVLVDHIADTAYERKRIKHRSEPEPLDGLDASEDSRSILRWMVAELGAPLPGQLWNLGWNDLLQKQLKAPLEEILLDRQPQGPVRRIVEPLTMTAWCVELSTLSDPDALSRLFVAPLRATINDGDS